MNFRRMILFSACLLFLIVPLYMTYQYFIQLMNVSGVRKPDVFLITVDTLQHAAVGSYGNSAVNTPFIDSIAKHGVLFPRGYAPIPTTGPSHTTILTGRSPSSHRVFRNAMKYGNEFPTLAKVFHDMGYRTAAFISGYSLTARVCGLDQGFDDYDDAWSEKQLERDAMDSIGSCMKWLNATDRFEPCFIWLHLFDPHAPYQERTPYIRLLRNGSVSHEMVDHSTGEQAAKYAQNVENAIQKQDFMVLVNNPMTTRTDKETLQRNWTAYLSEVCHVDRALLELKRYLQATDRWDRSLIIFTADHGEGFDHDYYFAHGDRLWESSVRVPWIVRFPLDRAKNTIARAIARHEDVFPTALSIAGIDLPFTGLQGTDLRMSMEMNLVGVTTSWVTIAPPLPRKDLNQGLMVAAYDHSFKLIRTVESGEELLFQVRVDPGETQEASEQNSVVKERLAKVLDRVVSHGRLPRSIDFDPGEIKEQDKLRSMGYIQ
ncbi:sulfatase [bacterium]|nr:sulfatase [candidate division CSSED10-310 bacterium]